MNMQGLRAELRSREGEMARDASRLAPTSFDPNDAAITALPLPVDWRWSTCAQFLKIFEARTVILQLPLFWQVYAPLRTVCRDIGCSIYPNEPENFPIGAAALRNADANMIIIEARNARRFSEYLLEKNLPFPSWIVVHRAEDEWILPPTLARARVAQEVHLFPGVPILYQCERLAETKSGFHRSDEFMWERGRIASANSSFSDLELPFTLVEGSACGCGAPAYTRV